MIFEWRIYDLKPARAPVYLDNFRKNGLGLVTRYLPLLGYWMSETGRLNRIHHLWAYASLDERDQSRASLASDQAWIEGFIPGAFVDVLEQHNLLLSLQFGSMAFHKMVEVRQRVHENLDPITPMFTPALMGLSKSETSPSERDHLVASFTIVSGGHVGSWLSLVAGNGDALLGEANGEHELIRPLTFSPIR